MAEAPSLVSRMGEEAGTSATEVERNCAARVIDWVWRGERSERQGWCLVAKQCGPRPLHGSALVIFAARPWGSRVSRKVRSGSMEPNS